jgi:catechol 2,3-dioxygenase-like lactoylglutathione lyase family enzyme
MSWFVPSLATIKDGSVQRLGAAGKILSIFFRDPDGSLIEAANQVS